MHDAGMVGFEKYYLSRIAAGLVEGGAEWKMRNSRGMSCCAEIERPGNILSKDDCHPQNTDGSG